MCVATDPAMIAAANASSSAAAGSGSSSGPGHGGDQQQEQQLYERVAANIAKSVSIHRVVHCHIFYARIMRTVAAPLLMYM